MATIEEFGKLEFRIARVLEARPIPTPRGFSSWSVLLPQALASASSMRRVTARQMRQIDRLAQEKFGIPELILMEHAGTAVAQATHRWLQGHRKRQGRVLVLAGGGANGGDGFVAARHLDNWGIPVKVVLISNPANVEGASQVNLNILRRLKVPVDTVRSLVAWRRWARIRAPRRVRVVIDALLGTGVSGQIREPIKTAIQWLNERMLPVISVDLPSGLSADTGLPCGVSVKAMLTLTCGLPKVGLTRGMGRATAGRVWVADISLPRVLR